MTGLETRNITAIVDSIAHLQDINLTFPKGKITTVIGRTLAGKTSLLRGIAGLLENTKGELWLDGQDISRRPAWKRNVAMVYQQFINYPHLNVYDNVAFPLRRRHATEDTIRSRVQKSLEMVGLSQYEKRKPSELSGGQQQRVALARALSREVDILLLDEPLVNLDYKLREQLREEFRGLLASRANTVVIYTTTEPAEAMLLSDQLVVMHEGCVVQVGTPAEVFERPASDIVASIINDPPITLLDGELDHHTIRLAQGIALKATDHMVGLASGRYRFGIRAGDITLGGQTVNGRVDFMEVTGSETSLYLETPCGKVTVQCEGVLTHSPGSLLQIDIPADRLYVFDATDGSLIASPKTIRG